MGNTNCHNFDNQIGPSALRANPFPSRNPFPLFIPDADVDDDVMHTLKGVNIIHSTMIDGLIDKQRVKEATMQPHNHRRLVLGGLSST